MPTQDQFHTRTTPSTDTAAPRPNGLSDTLRDQQNAADNTAAKRIHQAPFEAILEAYANDPERWDGLE